MSRIFYRFEGILKFIQGGMMKKIILFILFLTVTCTVQVSAQSLGRSSGCITSAPGDCPSYFYEGWTPFPSYETIPIFPNGVPLMIETEVIYVEGELHITAGFGCDQFTIVPFFELIVDYYSLCDACPQDNVGDLNSDDNVNDNDIIDLNNYLYGHGPEPAYLKYADVDGNCSVNSDDATYLNNYLNNGGANPAECACTDITVDSCAIQSIGDVNNDGTYDISDLVALMAFLYQGGSAPPIMSNADVNGDCVIDTNDVVLMADAGGNVELFVDCTCIAPTSCVTQNPGDFNSDGTFTIADMIFFAQYLQGGQAPFPLANADANGDCIINVGDSKLLNDFLFHGGPPPVDCTCPEPEYLTVCCWDYRGNADYDPADQIDVSDLVTLVSYMFQSGSDPICYEEADYDGSGLVDISDLVNMVSYMFLDGPNPASCP